MWIDCENFGIGEEFGLGLSVQKTARRPSGDGFGMVKGGRGVECGGCKELLGTVSFRSL